MGPAPLMPLPPAGGGAWPPAAQPRGDRCLGLALAVGVPGGGGGQGGVQQHRGDLLGL
jgi:hypothetical protein